MALDIGSPFKTSSDGAVVMIAGIISATAKEMLSLTVQDVWRAHRTQEYGKVRVAYSVQAHS